MEMIYIGNSDCITKYKEYDVMSLSYKTKTTKGRLHYTGLEIPNKFIYDDNDQLTFISLDDFVTKRQLRKSKIKKILR